MNNTAPQQPAVGILMHRDYGDTKTYLVTCACGCNDVNHSVWVEADDSSVTVTINSTVKTDFWTNAIDNCSDSNHPLVKWADCKWRQCWNGVVRRVRLTIDIWVHGYVQYESSVILGRQQAINYAETLKTAVADVEKFEQAQQ